MGGGGGEGEGELFLLKCNFYLFNFCSLVLAPASELCHPMPVKKLSSVCICDMFDKNTQISHILYDYVKFWDIKNVLLL